MPQTQFTPEEIAIYAAALQLRRYVETHLRPTTYGWLDAYTYDTNTGGVSGIGIKPNARAIAPGLPKVVAGQALVAFTIGILGQPLPSGQSAPPTWQQRLAAQLADYFPEKVPEVADLAAAWAALPVQPMLAGERGLLARLGIDASQRTNVTNALNGKRESLPAAIRTLLGSYLLPQ